MRPPMVRRWSGAPSRGQVAPRTRATWRSPVWLPPRSVSSRDRARRGGGAGAAPRPASSERAGRAGSMPGPPEDLVGEQVADAGDAALVEEPRLERRPAGGQARRAAAPAAPRGRRGRGGRRVGSSTTPPRRRGSTTAGRRRRRSAGRSGSTPARRGRSSTRALDRAVRRRRAAGRSSRSAARAVGAVGVEEQQLADPPGARDRRAPQRRPQRRRRGAALEVPVVGRVDPRDRRARRPGRRPAGSTPPRSSRARPDRVSDHEPRRDRSTPTACASSRWNRPEALNALQRRAVGRHPRRPRSAPRPTPSCAASCSPAPGGPSPPGRTSAR